MWNLKRGGWCYAPKYNAQVTQLLSGSFEVTIGDKTKILNGGDAFNLP